MNIIVNHSHVNPTVEEFIERIALLNLIFSASDAGVEMNFDSGGELEVAVKRSMETCIAAGIPVRGNFQRVYKCSGDGIFYDWKLSLLAYRLVCINGSSANRSVAVMMIRMLKQAENNNFK